MKRLLVIFVVALTATFSVVAQNASTGTPRAMGFRIGVTGFDASYQHVIKKNQFVQGDFGVDFGYSANGHAGVHAIATYNFIWARPAWTPRGYWAIYAGPGIALGYVNDMVHFRAGSEVRYTSKETGDNGFMAAVAGQVGLEYTFDFPMSIALEVRPILGIHVNDGVELGGINYAHKAGFYDNGFLGLVPALAIRYRF